MSDKQREGDVHFISQARKQVAEFESGLKREGAWIPAAGNNILGEIAKTGDRMKEGKLPDALRYRALLGIASRYLEDHPNISLSFVLRVRVEKDCVALDKAISRTIVGGGSIGEARQLKQSLGSIMMTLGTFTEATQEKPSEKNHELGQGKRSPPAFAALALARDLERRLKLDDAQDPESLQRIMQEIYTALDEIAGRIQRLNASAALEYRAVARMALKYLEAHPDKDAAEDLRFCVSAHHTAVVRGNQLRIKPPNPGKEPLTGEEQTIARTIEPILADTLEEVTRRTELIIDKRFAYIQSYLAATHYLVSTGLRINPAVLISRTEKRTETEDRQMHMIKNNAMALWNADGPANEPSLAELFRSYWESNKSEVEGIDLANEFACLALIKKIQNARARPGI